MTDVYNNSIRDQSRNVGHIALTNCWTC